MACKRVELKRDHESWLDRVAEEQAKIGAARRLRRRLKEREETVYLKCVFETCGDDCSEVFGVSEGSGEEEVWWTLWGEQARGTNVPDERAQVGERR